MRRNPCQHLTDVRTCAATRASTRLMCARAQVCRWRGLQPEGPLRRAARAAQRLRLVAARAPRPSARRAHRRARCAPAHPRHIHVDGRARDGRAVLSRARKPPADLRESLGALLSPRRACTAYCDPFFVWWGSAGKRSFYRLFGVFSASEKIFEDLFIVFRAIVLQSAVYRSKIICAVCEPCLYLTRVPSRTLSCA